MSTTVADESALSPPVAAAADRQALVADEFYSLAHWLRTGGDESRRAPTIVGITSCRARAGVSTVSWFIAAAAARSSHERVLLLDLSSAGLSASTESARPHGAIGSQSGSGSWSLRSDSSSGARPGQAARPTSVDNLLQLCVSDLHGFLAYGSEWHLVEDLLRSLQQDFDFIVVDLPTTDSSLCLASAGLLNGVLLVMEAERTHCEAAARAKQRLTQAHATVLGIVLNKHHTHLPKWLDARL